jgi:hypothetical protein
MFKSFLTILFVADTAIATYAADRQEFNCHLKTEKNYEIFAPKAQQIEVITQKNKMLIRLSDQNTNECDFVIQKSNRQRLYNCENLNRIIDFDEGAAVYLDKAMTDSKDGQLTIAVNQSTRDDLSKVFFVQYTCVIEMSYFNLKTGTVYEKVLRN